MPEIRFLDEHTYLFAKQLLEKSQPSWILQADDARYAIDLNSEPVRQLVARLTQGLPSVIPVAGDRYDEWIVVAKTQLAVDQTLQQLSRFLLPSYGAYHENSIFPQVRYFDNAPSHISNSYYSWYSPVHLRAMVIEKIENWLTLTSLTPSLEQMIPPNFKDLYHRFRLALSSQDWIEAQQIINQLKENHLTPDYNIAFLQIELLAYQQNYEAIWRDTDLKRWAFHTAPIPRRVQVAIIKAFHQQELLSLEQKRDYDAILTVLKREQSALGKLLTYRHEIIDDFVVRVFGYLAVLNETIEVLDELLQIASISRETKDILQSLRQIVRPAPRISSFERGQQLIRERKYDAAFAVAHDIEDPIQQVTVRLQAIGLLAQEHPAQNIPLQQVSDQFSALSEAEQQQILLDPFTLFAWREIQRRIEEAKAQDVFHDWIAWFDALFHEKRDTEKLQKSIAHLEATSDKEFWAIERVDQLWQIIGVMTFDPTQASPQDLSIITQPYFEQAIYLLIDQFTKQDTEFPRVQNVYGNLYGVFLEYLLNQSVSQRNADLLLLLADDQLSRQPTTIRERSQALFRWLGSPRSEVSAIALEAFELVIQHGLGKESLFNEYRAWVEQLMDVPLDHDRASLQVWQSLGEWFGESVDYLTDKMRKRLDKQSRIVDPVAQLPDGFHIVIYTLDASGAQRVSQILRQRHGSLRIDICADAVVTDRMRALAQNADMHVMVWRSMKHNVFYGISSYISSPVYSQSRGSTSILRAIEERASTLA